MDDVFRALADPGRRRLLDSLNARNGQTLRELCSELDMARQSVSKHLAVLEAANLVTTVRRGREKLHYLNAAPVNEIAERWINHYDRARVYALADLKTALEDSAMSKSEMSKSEMSKPEMSTAESMSKPEFVYTTYVRTTPEELWRALTEPAFTRAYWGLAFESDWKVGSTITLEQQGVTIADGAQVVLESDPPRRLAYTWHTFTPELAAVVGFDDETLAKLVREPRSKVSFEIEPVDALCKLTVVHDGFESGSLVLESISQGWPRVISELKSFLETGKVSTA
jgi:DNA-binding transcriptional ArsR family regulator/uncharacterized protein YndB with AHSA1/START domain